MSSRTTDGSTMTFRDGNARDGRDGQIVEQFVAEPVAGARTHVLDRDLNHGFARSDNDLPVRNRVQWGPIVAGTAIALASLLLLTILGLAIGTSAFEPGSDASDWGTGAGIYGAISAILAFFVAGWIAAKSAAVDGKFAGLMNGLLAGVLTLLVLLYLTTTGLTNFLGFLGSNVADISGITSDLVNGNGAANAADTAQATLQGNYDRVQNGAWGTLIALVLALGAAALGGLTGFNSRRDLVDGTGREGPSRASV